MERRVKPARRIRRRVEVRYGLGKADCAGYSGNISDTGMMVRSTRLFPPGSVLTLELKTATEVIQLRGTVTWARDGSVQLLPTGRVGMGITFIDPPADLIVRLQ